jgi:LPXTG-motif cell wall-anchored protein
VTDTGNVVGTYNAILGTAGTNNNGQNPMGYVVALTSGTPINNTADFAYGTTTPGGTTGTGGGTGGTTGTTGCEPNCPSSTSGSIGNLVFWDKDLDGIFNHSDIGIGGVEVTLYTDTNKNGVVDPGEPSQTRLTSLDPNDSGLYQFIGLDISNHYIVKFTDTLTLPSFGFEPSIVSGAGNQDNFSKDPTGYVVTTLSTSPSDQTADFGWKTTQILPETGQKRLMYGIVIVSVLVLGAFITLRRRKAI